MEPFCRCWNQKHEETQGQRKQEKESRARQESELTREVFALSPVFVFCETKQFRKLRCCDGMKYWIHKSIVAFPPDRLWLCGCVAVPCFETSLLCSRGALHTDACSFSQLSHQPPLKESDRLPEQLLPIDRFAIVKESCRVMGSETQSLNTRISLPPCPIRSALDGKFGLARLHLNTGRISSTLVLCLMMCGLAHKSDKGWRQLCA